MTDSQKQLLVKVGLCGDPRQNIGQMFEFSASEGDDTMLVVGKIAGIIIKEPENEIVLLTETKFAVIYSNNDWTLVLVEDEDEDNSLPGALRLLPRYCDSLI